MVPISPQAYSAEAVVFDTRPIMALQQKLAAQKAAKDEALDKYFLDLKNKINPAGMRTQDLPEWNKELADWISNGVMNRKEIAKGGVAQQEHLLKYQDLLSKVEQSKQMGKFQSELESKKQEGKIDADDFPLLDSIRLSIYNPLHYKNPETLTPYSMGDFSENIPTWDIAKSKQFYVDFARAGAKPAERINEKTTYNPNTRSYTTTYEEVYSLPQLKEMAIKGGAAITSDRSGYKTHKKILEEGETRIPSERFIDYAKAYSKIAPNDIMDTPEKVAAAGIVLNNLGVIDRKTETDIKREPPQGGGGGFGFGGKKTGPVRDLYKEIDLATSSPKRLKEGTGSPVNIFSGDAQKALINLANAVTGTTDNNQKNIFVQKLSDGKNYIMKAIFGDNKKVIGGEPLVPFTEEDINIRAQVDVGGKRAVVAQGQLQVPGAAPKKQYLIKGKTYSEAQLLNLGYTKDQIAPFLKK